ncbi:protein of unknown function (DUF4780) [Popillia japonica]|uniref:DUF4780 domain-containing protein n=1 Tax=Popillia japonica TaxID=7064 RepID=A0AAW1MG61_POPJA
MTEMIGSLRRPFTEAIAGGSFRRPSDDTETIESLRRPFTETITSGSFNRTSDDNKTVERFSRPSSEAVARGSMRRPIDMTEVMESCTRPFTETIMSESYKRPSDMAEEKSSHKLPFTEKWSSHSESYKRPSDMAEEKSSHKLPFTEAATEWSAKQSSEPAQNYKRLKTETQKTHQSDNSTQNKPSRKPRASTSTTTKSYKNKTTAFQMAIIHENSEVNLTEEETEKIKNWILQKIDRIEESGMCPRFIEESGMCPRFTNCKYRLGALHITCSDELTRDWLGQLKIAKPIRALFWVTDLTSEPSQILNRIGKQNPGISTDAWEVVDWKKVSKARQLIVRMDQNSWDKLGDICSYKPYFNFKRLRLRPLGKKKFAKEETQTLSIRELVNGG